MKAKVKYAGIAVLLVSMMAAIFSTPALALTPISTPEITPLVIEPKAPSELTARSWVYLTIDWRVKLEWQDNSSNETGFKIYRRAVDSSLKLYTLVDTVSADTTTYNDVDAELGKTYYYYVTAYNTAGYNSSDKVSVAVTDTVPDAATNLLAVTDSETDPTQVTFTWQDNSDNESGFQIYRRDWSGSTSYKLIATTLVNVESYVDSDVDVEGTLYFYRAVAYNNRGETVSSPDNWSVPFFLKAPTDFMGIADGTDINLTWTDNSEKEDAYVIYRCTDGASYALVDTTDANSTSYTDSGLEENTVYYYFIGAYFEAEPQLSSPAAYYAVLTGVAPAESGSSGSEESESAEESGGSEESSGTESDPSAVETVGEAASVPAGESAAPSAPQASSPSETAESASDGQTGESGAEQQEESSAASETAQQNSWIPTAAIVAAALILAAAAFRRYKLHKKEK